MHKIFCLLITHLNLTNGMPQLPPGFTRDVDGRVLPSIGTETYQAASKLQYAASNYNSEVEK
jgi:hypothetical protein